MIRIRLDRRHLGQYTKSAKLQNTEDARGRFCVYALQEATFFFSIFDEEQAVAMKRGAFHGFFLWQRSGGMQLSACVP